MKAPKLTRRSLLRMGALGGVSVAGGGGWGFYVEPNQLVVRHERVRGLGKVKVAHFADLQFKAWNEEHLRAVVAKVNDLKPDFVALTGDFIETPPNLALCLEILSGLKAPVFGIPGNHDVVALELYPEIARTLEKTGGAFLVNESRPWSKELTVVGLDECWYSHPDPEKAFRGLEPKKCLTLIHQPMLAHTLPAPVLLSLAGHSHGGQVRIPFIGAIHVPRDTGSYDWGMYQTENGPLHVTCGIGVLKSTPRFRCPPEVVMLTG